MFPKRFRRGVCLGFCLGMLMGILVALAVTPCAIAATAPSFEANQLSGETFQFDPNQNSKTTVLAFWASWCKTCKYETPKLIELQNQTGNQFQIIGISVDQSVDRAKAYIEKNQIHYTNLHDPNIKISSQFGVRGTPTFVVIDSKGNIAHRSNRIDEGFKKAVLN